MTAPIQPASNPQAGATQTDPAPSNPQAGGTTPSPDGQHPPVGEGQISADRVREIQRENQALRKRIEAEEEAKRQADLAKLGDVERLQKQLDDAAKSTKAAQDRAAQAEAMLIAKNLGIIYPDVAIAAIKDQLKVSKDGALENAEDLLKAFMESHPLIAAQGQPPSSPASQPQQVGIQPANPSRSAQTQTVTTGFDPAHPPSWRDVPFGKRPGG